jgi:hypothetical protein
MPPSQGFSPQVLQPLQATHPVILDSSDAEPILGVTALESVGILVDPATKTLRRLPAVPLK